MNEEYQNENAKIANIRMGANEKVYRVVQDTELENYQWEHANAGLEELYL